MKKPILALIVAATFVGCGGEKPAPSPAAGAAADGPPAQQAAPPVPDPVAGYADIGVPECDQYARKYLACLERVPEGSRAMARQSFDQTREVWSMTAEKPDRRAGLAAACRQQEQASKAAMARYDCDW
jgi:hypothetical protein